MSDPDSMIRRSRRSRWVWGVLLVVAIAAGYWFYAKGPAASKRAANPFSRTSMASMSTPVRIAVARQGMIDHTLKAIGTVTAFNTVTVRSRVDGELQKVLFADGQKVQQGDLLVQVDPRPFQVQLDQALGQQKQNEAQLINAQRDLKRYQLLYKQNSIAKQQVDAQQALVQQYLGSQKSDQAAVDSARLQLSFTRITAPISGRLGLRNVDEGNLVSASGTDGIVVITQTQPISVVFTLPQAQLPAVLEQVRAGRKLSVDLYDRNDQHKIATGELMSIDNQIDVATGTVKMKARFANEDESLFPNQFVNVRLRVGTQQAVLIPTAAVQQGSVGAFVYEAKEDDTVHVQPVTTGIVGDQQIAIASGLAEGARVVTEGVDRLREGAKIEVVDDSKPVADAGLPAVGRSPAGARRGSPH